MNPRPRRGEIWTAYLADAPQKHWVAVVSVDRANLSDRVSSVLVVPFGSKGAPGPTVLEIPPGESGLPAVSYLKGLFIQVLPKDVLLERLPRMFSARRMRQLVNCVRRAIDPDAPWPDE